MAMIRIDKFLADMSIGTRSQIKKMIREKRVKIEGQLIKKADTKISTDTVIKVDDEEIRYVEFEYYLLNKPAGYISATEDNYCATIMDLIASYRHDLSPVGRLDKDTCGAILITNDGMLNHSLLSPQNHIEKKYYFECDKPLPSNSTELLNKPIEFKEFTSLPAKLELINSNSGYLILKEGKYHQVKRMIAYLGSEVTYLRRDSFAFLNLDGLNEGEYRSLSSEEIKKLKSICNMSV